MRGYYGTVSHNVRSVYNRYLGWYDGNPANLDPLTPVESGERYVEMMGGAEAVLAKARQSFESGDYRWVAQLVNHVVFADPSNAAARELQADALEQLGYQSESATWRNAYLMGARELREGTPDFGRGLARDMSNAMQAEHIVDIIGVRFDPTAFDRGPFTVNIHLTDLGEDHVLGVGRSAIHHRAGVVDPDAVATIRAPRATLVNALNELAVLEAAEIDGDRRLVLDFFAGLTVFGTQALIEP